jgi:beta-N-acetylhexosaminidase
MKKAMALVALMAALGSQVAAPARPAREARPGRVDVAALKPPIVWKPIPYGDTRKSQMAAYSYRHYGHRTWHLRNPKVIVQHYTTGTTWEGAWNTFASNTKHNGEYPGTCAHFIVHTDGTIYQLVDLRVRCRHAVGMNYTSVGIEHVGTSDSMVLNNKIQMRASMRLTVWLMAKFGINIGNVIGHNESLESPYRKELYPDWWCLVHADFPHWAMHEYRQRLRDVAKARGVPVGDPPVWVDSGC